MVAELRTAPLGATYRCQSAATRVTANARYRRQMNAPDRASVLPVTIVERIPGLLSEFLTLEARPPA